jgi:hypothetical protein
MLSYNTATLDLARASGWVVGELFSDPGCGWLWPAGDVPGAEFEVVGR